MFHEVTQTTARDTIVQTTEADENSQNIFQRNNATHKMEFYFYFYYSKTKKLKIYKPDQVVLI